MPKVAPIRTAIEADADRLIDVMTLAYAPDPLVRWFVPDLKSYMRSMAPIFWSYGGRAALDAGTFRVMEDFSGWCEWLPPGWHVDDDGFDAMLKDCAPPDLMGEIAEVFSRMAAHHPKEPHWYLSIIVVDPGHQGTGVGARLLEDGLALCDKAQQICFLDATTPRSARLYERYGYKVLDEIQAGSSPPIYPMRREAN